jgi:hypothetical protein
MENAAIFQDVDRWIKSAALAKQIAGRLEIIKKHQKSSFTEVRNDGN